MVLDQANSGSNIEDKDDCGKHIHMCEIARYLGRIEKNMLKKSCEKLSIVKGVTKEYKIDENVIIKINDSGIYIHIKSKDF